MSLRTITRRLSESHRRNAQQRALVRAISSAPTPASRAELMALLSR